MVDINLDVHTVTTSVLHQPCEVMLPGSDEVNEMERTNRPTRTLNWSTALAPIILCLCAKGHRESGVQMVAFPQRDSGMTKHMLGTLVRVWQSPFNSAGS